MFRLGKQQTVNNRERKKAARCLFPKKIGIAVTCRHVYSFGQGWSFN